MDRKVKKAFKLLREVKSVAVATVNPVRRPSLF